MNRRDWLKRTLAGSTALALAPAAALALPPSSPVSLARPDHTRMRREIEDLTRLWTERFRERWKGFRDDLWNGRAPWNHEFDKCLQGLFKGWLRLYGRWPAAVGPPVPFDSTVWCMSNVFDVDEIFPDREARCTVEGARVLARHYLRMTGGVARYATEPRLWICCEAFQVRAAIGMNLVPISGEYPEGFRRAVISSRAVISEGRWLT